jgi:hypothetical protein
MGRQATLISLRRAGCARRMAAAAGRPIYAGELYRAVAGERGEGEMEHRLESLGHQEKLLVPKQSWGGEGAFPSRSWGKRR